MYIRGRGKNFVSRHHYTTKKTFSNENFSKEKKEKKKVLYPSGGKMTCNIFWKKYRRSIFDDYIFSKKPGRAWYCQGIFPSAYLYFLFFYFFLSGFAGRWNRSFAYYKFEGIRSGVFLTPFSGWKDSGMTVCQNKDSVNNSWYNGILLCAVLIVIKLPLHYSAEKKQFID